MYLSVILSERVSH